MATLETAEMAGVMMARSTGVREHSLVVEEVAEVLGGVGAFRVASVALGE